MARYPKQRIDFRQGLRWTPKLWIIRTLIYICGIFSLGFALFHMGFWRLFKWKPQLAKLNFANRGIMQILNIQLIYFFFFTAGLCFVMPDELSQTSLGHALLLGNALFWALRTLMQFVHLRADHIMIHLLTGLFLLGTVLFTLPVVLQWGL